jgi:hypothetical protein
VSDALAAPGYCHIVEKLLIIYCCKKYFINIFSIIWRLFGEFIENNNSQSFLILGMGGRTIVK